MIATDKRIKELSDPATTYEARIDNTAADAVLCVIGQRGMDALHARRLTPVDDGTSVGDLFAVGAHGASLATLYDALCSHAAHELFGHDDLCATCGSPFEAATPIDWQCPDCEAQP